MLPTPARLRSHDDFVLVVRTRTKIVRSTVIVHFRRRTEHGPRQGRAGFVVSKRIGGAVVRNRIKRRLRAALRECWHELPAGTDIVLRAQASAARVRYKEIHADLRQAVQTVAAKVGRRL